MINGSGVSRRGFLRGAGAAVLGLSLGRLSFEPAKALGATAAEPAAGGPDYRSWEDVYRARWTWDSIAKGTHYVNCWYQAHCNWNVYVKEGVVFREEQVANVPPDEPGRAGLQPARLSEGRLLQRSECTMPDGFGIRSSARANAARASGSGSPGTRHCGRSPTGPSMSCARTGPQASSGISAPRSPTAATGSGCIARVTVLDTPILDMNAEIGDHHPGTVVDDRQGCSSPAPPTTCATPIWS